MVLSILIAEQIGEDGRRTARVVDLEREVGPALVRLLRPRSPHLDTPDEDTMGGAIVVGLAGL